MSHVNDPDESEILAVTSALALLSKDAEEASSFPSAAALRLEAELRLEAGRAARRARILIGLHAGACALSLGLLAAVRVTEGRPGAPVAYGEAGTVCAIAAVVISIWNLFRTTDEVAVSS